MRWTAALGSSFARLSNVTVAKPIVRSAEIALEPAPYGLTTAVTCGSFETRPIVSVTAPRIAGSSSLPARA